MLLKRKENIFEKQDIFNIVDKQINEGKISSPLTGNIGLVSLAFIQSDI